MPAKPTQVTAPARARTFLDAQIAAVVADTLDSHDALRAYFAPAAAVMWPSSMSIDAAMPNLREYVLALDPPDELVDAKITKLVAGGTDRAVWFQFELTIHQLAHSDPSASITKVIVGSELGRVRIGRL
ncbi:MAG: hypothetical protein JWP01_438 [Myxococcales bacterium]|nr:hypothetical protein [Myxococcales bacterium]